MSLREISEIVNESKSSDLQKLFVDAIDEVDDSLSYKDLAETVANILIDEYGPHNYKPFMSELKKRLKG